MQGLRQNLPSRPSGSDPNRRHSLRVAASKTQIRYASPCAHSSDALSIMAKPLPLPWPQYMIACLGRTAVALRLLPYPHNMGQCPKDVRDFQAQMLSVQILEGNKSETMYGHFGKESRNVRCPQTNSVPQARRGKTPASVALPPQSQNLPHPPNHFGNSHQILHRPHGHFLSSHLVAGYRSHTTQQEEVSGGRFHCLFGSTSVLLIPMPSSLLSTIEAFQMQV